MIALRTRLSRFESPRKLEAVALMAIVIVATVLRFYRLGAWSFWIDEIYTIGRVQEHYHSLEATLHNIPPHTNWIPSSLLLIAGLLNILGVSEWTARLGPAIIGVISIPLLYVPAKRFFGARAALISSLLLAISPWHLTWSQNARFYAALMLFYTLALFAILFGLERDRPSYLVLGIALFYLAVSERILALLLLPTVGLYLLFILLQFYEKPPGFNRRNLIIIALPVLAGLLIEGYSFLTTGNSRFFGDFGVFLGNPIDSPVRILILTLFSIGLPVVSLAPFGGAWLVRQRDRAGLAMLVAAVAPVLLLIGVSPFVFVVDRYALITLPAWLILAGITLDRLAALASRYRSWVITAALCVFITHSSGEFLMYYALNDGNRPDWRGAFLYVENARGSEDLIVSTRPEIGQYYLGEGIEIQSLHDIDPAALASESQPAWFVVDSEAIWSASEANRQWMERNTDLLFVWYLRMREQVDLKVYHYDPPDNLLN